MPGLWMAVLMLSAALAMLVLAWLAQCQPAETAAAQSLRPLPILALAPCAKVRPSVGPRAATPCRAPPVCQRATQLADLIPPRRG